MLHSTRMNCCVQVVGAVGWGNARLPIPEDIAPELKDLLEACWDEPTVRPGFEGVLNVLKTVVAQPNFVFQSKLADDGGASQDLSRPFPRLLRCHRQAGPTNHCHPNFGMRGLGLHSFFPLTFISVEISRRLLLTPVSQMIASCTICNGFCTGAWYYAQACTIFAD